MSNLKPVPPTGLPVEYVACALCSADDARALFLVPFADRQLSRLWQGDHSRPLHGETALVQCRRCGLAYVNPRITEQPGIASYNNAEEMQYFANTRTARQQAFEELLDRIPAWLGRPPQSLADIGCGDGLLLELALARGLPCTGVETSQALLDRLEQQYGAVAHLSSSLDTLPQAAFDVVVLINVIEHIREPQPFLRQLRRIIQPGGLLLVHAPNFGGLPARLRGPRWHQIEPLEHFHYYTARTLGKMLSRTGFRASRRFSLIGARGWKAHLQRGLSRLGIYLDNGLGIVAVPGNNENGLSVR